MVLVGIGLCLIGVGIIGHDVLIASQTIRIPRRVPKGRPAGTYETDMEWEFPED